MNENKYGYNILEYMAICIVAFVIIFIFWKLIG